MQEEKPDTSPKRGWSRIAFLVLLVLAVFCAVVMVLNSRKPQYHNLEGLDKKVKGAHFVKVNEMLIQDMAGNWLPNDLFWPTALLDNMPNFQLGVLEVVRYNARVLRDNLSRMRTTDRLDPNAEAIFTNLSNDPLKWWFPSAESKWKLALEQLGAYNQSLFSGKAHFYPRADNLIELLNQYLSLMGGVNTRLINAPRDLKSTLGVEEQKDRASPAPTVDIDIPWTQIDDNFYYAQGVAHALHESFRAIRVDFHEVLTDKNSVGLVDKILEILGRCHFEPLIIFNGDPDSIFANHSLNLSGIFNDARQKMNSLTVALMQG
ncbi:MAG: DUF2333 family protein [Deltaproteobacteria bacterium]